MCFNVLNIITWNWRLHCLQPQKKWHVMIMRTMFSILTLWFRTVQEFNWKLTNNMNIVKSSIAILKDDMVCYSNLHHCMQIHNVSRQLWHTSHKTSNISQKVPQRKISLLFNHVPGTLHISLKLITISFSKPTERFITLCHDVISMNTI